MNTTIQQRILISSSWILYLLVLAPLITLVVIAIVNFSYEEWPVNTIGIFVNTLGIAFATCILAIFIGTSCAWLVETCIFPGRKIFAWALFIPFAIPPYVQAYIWGELIDDSGLFVNVISIRNEVGASLVMALVLYPYVYLFTRASFANRSCNLITTSRLLGCTPFQAFVKVALPLAQPTIAIGATLVFMEVLNDIAIAQNFGLNTIGYQIYDLWLNRGNQETAIAITLLLVLLSFVIIFFEVMQRKKQRQYESTTKCFCDMDYYKLSKVKSYLVVGYCCVIVLLGFILPLVYLVIQTISNLSVDLNQYTSAVFDTIFLVLFVLVVALIIGFAIVKVKRKLKSKYIQAISILPTTAYALPGIIYSLGFIVFVSLIANMMFDLTGISLHWLWISTPVTLIFALAFRYCIIITGAIEVGFSSVSPKLISAGKSLDSSYLTIIKDIYLPLMKTTLIVGGVLLATDIIKELPLTLILRPLGTDTLALIVFQYTTDEDLNKAAPYALSLIILTSILLTIAFPHLLSFVNRPVRS